jgi:uncharacterized membrane protein YjjB (DUF3815 family)
MTNSDPVTGLSEMSAALGIGAALASGVVLGEWMARALRSTLAQRVPALLGARKP